MLAFASMSSFFPASPLNPLPPWHRLHSPENCQVERNQYQQQDYDSDSQHRSKGPVTGLQELVRNQVAHKDIFRSSQDGWDQVLTRERDKHQETARYHSR